MNKRKKSYAWMLLQVGSFASRDFNRDDFYSLNFVQQ